ncbi:hypothetical protein ABZS66_51220, partial [Dactylosporangium sp. NPDC005572]|uniref:hypothetical protein n=1 Tax=Dactylosporangium sp. NPDC005572 TaxID=3156889 RepID=UPI0033B7109F
RRRPPSAAIRLPPPPAIGRHPPAAAARHRPPLSATAIGHPRLGGMEALFDARDGPSRVPGGSISASVRGAAGVGDGGVDRPGRGTPRDQAELTQPAAVYASAA